MTHILTQEEDNYIRLDQLITGVSQRAARFFFDKEFVPVCLCKSINKEINKLTYLKKKRIINQKQWNLLFPLNGDPDSKTFDINLITTLLRNLTDLPSPNCGYDKLPLDEEDSPVSDLARLKHYRNYLAHIDDKKVENDYFSKAWADISLAIKRLGTEDMAKECEKLRVQYLNQSAVSYNDKRCSNIEEWHLIENPINTETNLKKLEDSMRTKKCVILKGLIGTGKSELALRYCYNARKLDPTGIVHKLKCTDESMFERSLRELCKYFQDVEVRKEEQSQTNTVIDLIAKELRKRASHHHILLLDDIKQIAKHTVSNFIKTCKRAENIKIIATTSLALDIDKDYEVLEIRGFSEDEAVYFLSYGADCQETKRKHYKELARRFSFNPKGLHIARTYMEQTKLPVKDFVKQLGHPSDLLEFEESLTVKEQITDKTLFHSLVSLVENMHDKYKREGKEHIFEMLLSLQFLEVETIPVILFEKFDSDVSLLSINDLLYEIRNSSFGTIYIEERTEEVAEERQINTHDVVRLALQIYMTDRQGIIHTTNEKILRKLLRAFFLLMDKDNQNPSDLHRHNLLLPHACAVIKHLKKMKISEKDKSDLSLTQDILHNQLENDLHVIYVKDILGYTYSFSDMYYEASSYFDEAKSDLLELLKVNDEKFHNDLFGLTKLTSDLFELTNLVEKISSDLFQATEKFIREHRLALQTIGKDYVLNKYRNRGDVEILKGVLRNHDELEKTTHLVEREYNELCMKGYAVPEDRLGNEFMLSLLISVFHTFGRRLFYQPDDIDWSLGKIFFSYLAVARNLSYMTNLKDNHLPDTESTKQCEKSENMQFHRLSSCLTERSEMQSVLNFFGRKENQVKAVTLKDIISTCKKRFNEKIDYLEFGVLKVLGAKNDLSKYLSAKMILNCYKVLFKTEQTEEIRLEATQWGQNITKMIAKNQSTFPSLEYSIGELYFAIGDILEAEKCFYALLPKIDDNNKCDKQYLEYYPRKACVSYIKCRLERSEQEDGFFKEETLRKLECFKTLLQTYKAEFKELEELELTLREVNFRTDI